MCAHGNVRGLKLTKSIENGPKKLIQKTNTKNLIQKKLPKVSKKLVQKSYQKYETPRYVKNKEREFLLEREETKLQDELELERRKAEYLKQSEKEIRARIRAEREMAVMGKAERESKREKALQSLNFRKLKR
jgi:hypothetical protein